MPEVQKATLLPPRLSHELDAGALVKAYHQRSKHALSGYAAGPETIDWDNQPDPFRRFEGAPLVRLPLLNDKLASDDQQSDSLSDTPSFLTPKDFHQFSLNHALQPSSWSPRKFTLATLAALLEHSLALSAWKQLGGARWSMRCNPSSGNLHPTEAYLLVAGVNGLDDGLYHYRADIHGLELRCRFSSAIDSQSPMCWLGLSSVHWREAWKYGERAYRYCQLDSGHAIAALGMGAALNGWTLKPLAVDDASLSQLLGLNRRMDFIEQEAELPDGLLQLVPASTLPADEKPQPEPNPENLLASLLNLSTAATWYGKAAVLDRRHFYQWPVVDQVAAAAAKTQALPGRHFPIEDSSWPAPQQGSYRDNLRTLIRLRRSAQGFDGYTTIKANDFWVLLDHLLPRADLPPWAGLTLSGQLHLVLFVHRVEGLAPGLYALARSAAGEQLMRQAMRTEFQWQAVAAAPDHLRFYQLIQARTERTAARLSCHQPIASDSAFSLAMLAEFDQVEAAPWRYRELLQEAGAIGQQLYLEAEAVGLRGTGIGCFFDDAVHDILGLTSTQLQSLYHFTVGGPLLDQRIVTLPPYSAKQRDY